MRSRTFRATQSPYYPTSISRSVQDSALPCLLQPIRAANHGRAAAHALNGNTAVHLSTTSRRGICGLHEKALQGEFRLGSPSPSSENGRLRSLEEAEVLPTGRSQGRDVGSEPPSPPVRLRVRDPVPRPSADRSGGSPERARGPGSRGRIPVSRSWR